QEPPIEHATGLILESPERLRSVPTTPAYRAFLPERIDLSKYFPTPGNQGNIGSCAAWAVGYAARAYYARAIEGRDLEDRRNIPSPGYIYSSIVEPPGDCMAGSSTLNALNLLKDGSLSWRQFPTTGTCARPTTSQRAGAQDFRIDGYR